jgi:tRNA A37 threonylcarbamoyltransferase TsaD
MAALVEIKALVKLVLVVAVQQSAVVLAAVTAAPGLFGMVQVGAAAAAQVDILVTAAMAAVKHLPHPLVLVAVVAVALAITEAASRWAQVEVLGF